MAPHSPSLLGSPCLAGPGCLCVFGKGVMAATHTTDPSCLWTLKNPIFFLIATARALSPRSLLLLGGDLSPHAPPAPASCCPPHGGCCPPSRSPVSGRTIYHVLSWEGLGE